MARRSSLTPVLGLLATVTTISTVAVVPPTALAQNGFDVTEMVGPPGSGRYGNEVVVLANGNYAISDPLFDGPAGADVGAVYLYDGATNALISTLTGATADDRVGSGGLTPVGQGNVVVSSPAVTISGENQAGAVTFVDGRVGLAGSVSPANSLVGSTGGDAVGSGDIVRLTNGNYVVASPAWNNGPFIASVGAVTWGSGTAGVVGAVSAANSQIGAVPSAAAGADGIVALTNGNYVSYNSDMPVGAHTGAGAVTWGDGSIGSTGTITAANSLVGDHDDDHLAEDDGVVALSNGNYAFASSRYDAGGVADAGAVTWGNGATGAVAPLAARSVVGAAAFDRIGVGGVTPLTNGNYVISSYLRPNGAMQYAGAATWASGAGSTVGAVTAANSLLGTHADDLVGWGLVALANGNFLVLTPNWDNAATVDVGAVTWRSGTSASSGVVSAPNSLIGATAYDNVGDWAVALANGHAVVSSPSATIGGLANAGAATWLSGTAPTVATVSAANSLVGTHVGDGVADRLVALPNGNYVVVSANAQVGTTAAAGAVTLGFGTAGTTGTVSAANSLVGSNAADLVGAGGITVLADGNYVVTSPDWSDGATAHVGAVTWRSASAAATGVVGSSNSTIGSKASGGPSILEPVPTAAGGFLVTFRESDVPPALDAGVTVYAAAGGSPGAVDASDRAVFGMTGGAGDAMYAVGDRTAASALFVARPAENIVTRIDDVDTTPPVFAAVPADVTVAAEPGATTATVTFATPPATDNILPPTVTCAPASGTSFPVGATLVTCTARDRAGLLAKTAFTVTVTATPASGGGGGGGSGGGGGGGGGGGNVTDYVALVPSRLVDTRLGEHTADGRLEGGGPLAGGTTVAVPTAGRGGVAGDALAATLNITAVNPVVDAFVTVFPCGSPRPTASNLNVDAGAVAPNTVVAKLGDDGSVCVFVSQTMHVVVDANGYFPASSTYVPANPQRVLDTRTGELTADSRQQGGGIIPAGTTTELQLTGRVGVPVDASAVALNVTITGAQGPGYVTVYPCGAGRPNASSLNASGSDVANLVVATLGTDGKVCLFNQTAMHLVADVNGWFPATTSYAPLTPDRLLDTRSSGAPPPGGTVTRLRVAGVGTVPAAVATVVLNVTVTEPTASGYVTVYPCGVDRPLASNLNYAAGQTVPNAVIVKVGTEGSVCLESSQPVHLVADVTGYFPT